METLRLLKADMGACSRVHAFLSQILDYGNTALEKRAILCRRLVPLPELGREREGIDLSKVTTTHHRLRTVGEEDGRGGGEANGGLPRRLRSSGWSGGAATGILCCRHNTELSDESTRQ